MPDQTDGTDEAQQPILSGPEVVRKFVESLAKDTALDPATVIMIHQLYQDNKLTHTNLLSMLEAEREKLEG